MNLKKIEMFGFKSFADRQAIEFKDGISGIVGPNGCGKSNVVDAIRWVLGEGSAKSLRGGNMQDLIFNGTKTRNKMGVCEVSITFDNTNRIFPVELDELKMTRKIYRGTSDSSYFINDEKAKKSDIEKAIQNTGLGKEGYSVIGQGKVAEILNSKPRDRRRIFEDAAGISGYKKTKEDTEANLRNAQLNLDRINDTISIIGADLEPLRKRRDDALRYADLASELKGLEVNKFIFQKENCESKKSVINSVIYDLQTQMDDANSQKDKASAEYRKYNNENSNIDTVIKTLTAKREEIAVESEKARSSSNMLKVNLENLEAKRSECEDKISKNTIALDKKNDELQDLRNRLSMKIEERDDLAIEFRKYEDSYLKMSEELINQERGINDSNEEILLALQDMADIKEDKGKLIAKRESFLERIAECESEIERLEKLIDDEEKIKNEIEKQVSALNSDRARLNRSTSMITDEYKKVRSEFEEKKMEKDSLASEIHSLEGKIEGYKVATADSYRGAVNSILQIAQNNPDVKSRIVGVVGKMVTVEDKYNAAIEIALGGRVYQLVTATDTDATYLTEIAKRYNIGRITCIPLNRQEARELPYEFRSVLNEKGVINVASKLVAYDKKYDVLFSTLLGSTVIVDNKANALAIAAKYRYRVRLVTLDGDAFDVNRTISGGSMRVKGDLFGNANDIDELKKAVVQKKKQYQSLGEEIEDLKDQVEELEGQIEEYNSNLRKVEMNLLSVNAKLEKKTEDIEALSNSLTQNVTIRDNFTGMAKTIEVQLSALNVKTESSTGKRVKANEFASQKREEIEGKRKEREEVNSKKEEKRSKLAVAEKEIETFKESIESLTLDIVELKKLIADDSIILNEVNIQIAQRKNELDNVVIIDEYKEEYDKIVEQLSRCDERKEELQRLIEDCNILREKASKIVETLIVKIEKQKAELEKVDTSLATLAEYIEQTYSLTYDECQDIRREDFDAEGSERVINKIKKEIESLGQINPHAVQDYAEKSAFYQAQVEARDDVSLSMEKMQEVINELKKVMTERFNSEFEKINTNFETIYKELFGGGVGKLELVAEDGVDPLDYGVEILAQPPGKALNKNIALSGGEMALTAIAILFAIQALKAMPFCVLDEIEAALDDANAGRFAKYLKRFSSKTQFIVITHRKPTMQIADVLYGVTMQEKGVSKIVATSLKEYKDKE